MVQPAGTLILDVPLGAGMETEVDSERTEDETNGVELAGVGLAELTDELTDELAGELPLGWTEGVSVTRHTVVEIGMVEVTTEIDFAGQSVTVGAQLVTVNSLVV